MSFYGYNKQSVAKEFLMKIISLLENRTLDPNLTCHHGLSLYIETAHTKILFDTGQNDAFIHNAKKLGVNLKEVDMAFLSHGHYDHGGGLKYFLEINTTAQIYLSTHAFDQQTKKLSNHTYNYIGIDESLKDNPRFNFVDSNKHIGDFMYVFSDVKGKELLPPGNDSLYTLVDDHQIHDQFQHELNLVICEDDNEFLFSGCAHRGIINIINSAEMLLDTTIDYVIAGFHLNHIDLDLKNDVELLDQLINRLSKKPVKQYYTCHCTGEHIFNYMSEHMDNIDELKTGSIISI